MEAIPNFVETILKFVEAILKLGKTKLTRRFDLDLEFDKSEKAKLIVAQPKYRTGNETAPTPKDYLWGDI